MTFIWFLYYSVVYDNEKNKYGGKPQNEGVKAIVLGFGLGVVGIVGGILFHAGLWQLIVENWPYEYGRAHSKNFVAPTGILGLLVLVLVYFSVKKYFSNDKRLAEIEKCFNHGKGNRLATKLHLLPYVMIFVNAFIGAMFAGGFWIAFSICCGFYCIAELWIRSSVIAEGNKLQSD